MMTMLLLPALLPGPAPVEAARAATVGAGSAATTILVGLLGGATEVVTKDAFSSLRGLKLLYVVIVLGVVIGAVIAGIAMLYDSYYDRDDHERRTSKKKKRSAQEQDDEYESPGPTAEQAFAQAAGLLQMQGRKTEDQQRQTLSVVGASGVARVELEATNCTRCLRSMRLGTQAGPTPRLIWKCSGTGSNYCNGSQEAEIITTTLVRAKPHTAKIYP